MGLAIGMGALAAMPDALPCINDATPLVTEVEALINEIKTHPTDILNIIKAVEKIAGEFSGSIAACGSLANEGKAFFANVASHFTNSTLRN